MHTNEWPARRCSDTKQQPVSYWPPRDLGDPDRDAEAFFSNVVPFGAAESSTEIGSDMPATKREACSPAVGVLIGATLGALMICGAVWLWRSLL